MRNFVFENLCQYCQVRMSEKAALVKPEISRKNNQCLKDVNNFHYICNYIGKVRTNWWCSQRQCKAKIITDNN